MSDSSDYRADLFAAVTFLEALADTLDEWAAESRSGGWSTHQVDENRKMADSCRRVAARFKRTISKGAP